MDSETPMSGLSSIFSIGLSGLNAAGAMFGASAHNIANAETPGFRSTRVRLTPAPDGSGVRVDYVRADKEEAKADEEGPEGSDVDIAAEFVHVRRAALLYKANASVIRIGDSLMGTLLDTFDTRRLGRR
jgi:flagellar hook protein FlgE